MQSKTHVGEGECAYADQIAVGLNLAMEAFGITSMQRAAAAIGQSMSHLPFFFTVAG